MHDHFDSPPVVWFRATRWCMTSVAKRFKTMAIVVPFVVSHFVVTSPSNWTSCNIRWTFQDQLEDIKMSLFSEESCYHVGLTHNVPMMSHLTSVENLLTIVQCWILIGMCSWFIVE